MMHTMTVDVADLLAAIDDSVDNYQDDLACLYDEKLSECSDEFIGSCIDGIAAPIVICVNGTRMSPDRWVVGNGNHRLAVAIAAMLTMVPIVLTDETDYMLEEISERDDLMNSGGGYDNACPCGCGEDDEQSY